MPLCHFHRNPIFGWMLKRYTIPAFLFALFLIWQLPTQAQLFTMDFRISPEGADVLLEWEPETEKDVVEYRLFRKFNNEPTLTHVSTVEASGKRVYKFLDDEIFKNSSRVINYELHVIIKDRPEPHKFHASLSHNPTSIQRTWGSIKAMFRG